MFSYSYPIEDEAKYLADTLNEKKINSVVTIYFDNIFSRTHEDTFNKYYKGKNLETIRYSDADLTQIKSAALRIKQLSPEAIYAPDAFPLMQGLTDELSRIAVNTPIYSVFSAQHDDVKAILKKSKIKLHYTYPLIDGDALDFYPREVAKTICEGIKICEDFSPKCLENFLKNSKKFDPNNGAISAKFILKELN